MNTSNLNYKHIIWDWNGTLLNDSSTAVKVMNTLLDKRHMPLINQENYRNIFEFPVRNYYDNLGFDYSNETFETISNEFVDVYQKFCYDCSLHENAENVLKLLIDKGISHSILSASRQDYLEHFVDFFNISKYFIGLVGLDNNHAESKIEKGKRWISSLPYKQNEILLIGDTTHDYETAKAMGCDCILLSCGHQSTDKLKYCSPDIYDSLLDIVALFS